MRVLLLVVHPNFTSCIITRRDATLNIPFNFFRTFTILLQFWSTSMEDWYICYKSEFFIGWVWKGGRQAGKMDHFFIDFPSSLFARFILKYLIPVQMYWPILIWFYNFHYVSAIIRWCTAVRYFRVFFVIFLTWKSRKNGTHW